MFAVLVAEALLKPGFHLVLVDKLYSVLLVHTVTFFLVHHINQLGLVQPLHHIFGYFIFRLNSLKGLLESHVKLVKIRLAFHKNHSGKVIKLRQAAPAKSLIQRLLQGQPLA